MGTLKTDVIHETIIRDIIDVVKDVKDLDEIELMDRRKTSYSSITRASDNLTLVFPVIFSSSMNIENASMVAKAIERKAVTMLQMLFSALSITDAEDGIQYLSRFHKNLKLDNNVTVDSFISAMDSLISEGVVRVNDTELYTKVKKDLNNINKYLPDSINETSLCDYSNRTDMHGKKSIVLENNGRNRNTINNYNTTNSNPNINIKISNPSGGGSSNGGGPVRGFKDGTDIFNKQVMSSDVKKANELIPTMMIVNFISTAGDSPIEGQMVVGVKAKLYNADSSDIMQRLAAKHVDRNWLLKLIKSTTREISFVRDFLFAIDKAKLDALSTSRKGSSSKLWKILERRSLKSKVRRTLGHTNDASAITTIVITQEEVEYMRKTSNINLQDPYVIRPMLEAYNLMGFVIVDDATEIANFLFDTGHDIYESVPFTALERESADGGHKKMVNLLSKMR